MSEPDRDASFPVSENHASDLPRVGRLPTTLPALLPPNKGLRLGDLASPIAGEEQRRRIFLDEVPRLLDDRIDLAGQLITNWLDEDQPPAPEAEGPMGEALRLTGTERAAALLIGVGDDLATKLFALLTDDQQLRVAQAIITRKRLSFDTRDAVLMYAYEGFQELATTVPGGRPFAEAVIRGALSNTRGKRLLRRLQASEPGK